MFVFADNALLQYSGRIDFDDPKAPVLVYAASNIRMKFTGTSVRVVIANHRSCYINQMGFILDGVQGKFVLMNTGEKTTYLIAQDLEDKEHELLLFKRMDACHMISFYGFVLEESAQVLPLPPKPERRMEFFGDSVSCGEVSEAVGYVGQCDPEGHEGIFSNSWYSYSWLTARKLGAELHVTSQGGIALLDGTGWFHAPVYPGVESCYDKIEYNPETGPVKQWDFDRYQPQVVVVAIGQNDNHPEDYMAADYDGEKAVFWRKRYQAFIEKLLSLYPKATVILTTTILGHDASWDRAIGEVCQTINSSRVHHFLYTKNGCGTCGHIRIPEAELMAEELSTFINSLGDIWV